MTYISDKPKLSPWGDVEHCEVMSIGIYSVDTANHGGIMIEAEYAKKILSPEAQKCGFEENGYLNFEEDCAANVAVRELLDSKIWEIPDKVKDKVKFENNVDSSIKRWYPEYWEAREKGLLDIADNKQYIVYDFLIGNPVLIDTKAKTLSFYGHNIYGQIHNLKNPEVHKVTAKTINGLIKRTKNFDYFSKSAKAIDKYIYSHFMTKEQQEQCVLTPYILSKKIIATNDFKKAVKKMCEWVYEKECAVYDISEKQSKKQESLKYCEDYLNSIEDIKSVSKDNKRKSVIQTLNENKKKVKPPELANKAKIERNELR